jgi:FkbM family methyltransferase
MGNFQSLGSWDSLGYVDENKQPIAHKIHQRTEQRMAYEHIHKEATVLELGARYGMVSCTIGHKLSDSSRLVVVEPDGTVIEALRKNKEVHELNFHIYSGAVSKQPLKLVEQGYASETVPLNDGAHGKKVSVITYENLEWRTGLKFDCLVADCEGSLGTFLIENEHHIQQFKMVMYEADRPDKCDYTQVNQLLTKHGLKCVESGKYNVWHRPAAAYDATPAASAPCSHSTNTQKVSQTQKSQKPEEKTKTSKTGGMGGVFCCLGKKRVMGLGCMLLLAMLGCWFFFGSHNHPVGTSSLDDFLNYQHQHGVIADDHVYTEYENSSSEEDEDGWMNKMKDTGANLWNSARDFGHSCMNKFNSWRTGDQQEEIVNLPHMEDDEYATLMMLQQHH